MRERLQRILTAEGLAPAKFAEIIGVQRSSISHILSGRNNPSYEVILKILEKFPKINPDWLITSRGEMYRKLVQTTLFSDPPQPNIKEDDPPLKEHKQSDLLHNINKLAVGTEKIKGDENRIFEKKIDRVVIFYNDRTFTEYHPE